MKSRILIVVLFALSSCGSTEYEKAIADWLQTDENGLRLHILYFQLLGYLFVIVTQARMFGKQVPQTFFQFGLPDDRFSPFLIFRHNAV